MTNVISLFQYCDVPHSLNKIKITAIQIDNTTEYTYKIEPLTITLMVLKTQTVLSLIQCY